MSVFKYLKSVTIPQNKHTDGLVVMPLPVPDCVYIALNQGSCAPAHPLVRTGEYVRVGQLIADGEGPLSCPIHASVSGTVSGIVTLMSCEGVPCPHIVIKSDKSQNTADISPVSPVGRKEFIEALRNSGIVDPSEGNYPLSYKFDVPAGSIDTLLVNGVECESFLTSDHMTMMTYSPDILSGIHMIMRSLNIPNCVIAISDNKSDAVLLFNKHISDLYIEDICVKELPSVYPIGEENSVVYAATGRLIPAGKQAKDVGVVTCNVSCILKFKQYLDSGMPLVSKAVTVDGDAVSRPQNVEIPVGTLVSEIMTLCRGDFKPVRKIVFGGPLYGMAVPHAEISIGKLVGGIVLFTEKAAITNPETQCIRCGKCVQACPIGLMPLELSEAYKCDDWVTLRKMNAQQCVGCNACSFICPARKPLAFQIIQAKSSLDREEGRENG